MAKKLLFAIGLILALPCAAQEMVVFRDFRSLAVLSHRAQGEWTYLRMADGELAVKSMQILEIRKEPAGSQAGALSSPLPQAPPQPPANAMPQRGWRPEPPQPQPEPQEEFSEPPPEPEPEPEPEPPPPLPPPTQKVE